MEKRDLAIDLIKEVVNLHGRNIANDRKDLYRSRVLLKPALKLSDDEDNNLVVSKVIVSEFHNGIPQLAFEIADLCWKSFSSCDEEYLSNIAIRLCKKYNCIAKANELLGIVA